MGRIDFFFSLRISKCKMTEVSTISSKVAQSQEPDRFRRRRMLKLCLDFSFNDFLSIKFVFDLIES